MTGGVGMTELRAEGNGPWRRAAQGFASGEIVPLYADR